MILVRAPAACSTVIYNRILVPSYSCASALDIMVQRRLQQRNPCTCGIGDDGRRCLLRRNRRNSISGDSARRRLIPHKHGTCSSHGSQVGRDQGASQTSSMCLRIPSMMASIPPALTQTTESILTQLSAFIFSSSPKPRIPATAQSHDDVNNSIFSLLT